MFTIFRKTRTCRQLGEVIADGLDAGFMSLLTELEKRGQPFLATPEAIAREIAFLEVFIVERAVGRMISERTMQGAKISAVICRVVSRSGILPSGQEFQRDRDSYWKTFSAIWNDRLDGRVGMALATAIINSAGATPHYELLTYIVQLVVRSHTDILKLLRDYQKEFTLSE
jgi:hypothetical protein